MKNNFDLCDCVDIAISVDKKYSDILDMDMNTDNILLSQYLNSDEFYNESSIYDEELPETDESSVDMIDIAADDLIDAQYSDEEDIIDLVAGL